MYATILPRIFTKILSLHIPTKVLSTLGFSCLLLVNGSTASAQPEVIRNITQPTERLELTVNSSRILTLDKRIPKMVVNNPDLVSATPISANQVQLAARKPGVTQINLWDEAGEVYTVDLMIYGDVRELEHALRRLFPESSVKVVRLTNSLVLEGFVERPEAVSPILRLAEDYAPKVVNNITVGGVQQVLLKVKVMEVSRTKLRTLGVDWAFLNSNGSGVQSSISGLISSSLASGDVTSVGPAGGETFSYAVLGGGDSFFGFLEALQQNNLAKILADPTITAISGRPAHFNVGGELPIIIPSGIGQTTVEYKEFGTQVDFVPIVLGNGNIRLEVRPRVSEIDDTRSVNIGSFSVPALKVRQVDTGVELKAGQTLALAGLVQTRVEAQERGLPYVSDLPYIGSAFRKVTEEVNEIELLILVTPEFVDGMDAHEVPQCGPGMESVSPTNCQLYWGGHLEMPSCGPCSPYAYGDGSCSNCQSMSVSQPIYNNPVPMSTNGYGNPGEVYNGVQEVEPMPSEAITPTLEPTMPESGGTLPGPQISPDPSARQDTPTWMSRTNRSQMPAHFSRDEVQYRTSSRPTQRHTATPGLIGPVGYDTE